MSVVEVARPPTTTAPQRFAPVVVLVVFALSGCAAYFEPMVDAVHIPRGDKNDKTMPQLGEAVAGVDERIDQMKKKRDGTILTARALDFLTFGLAAGATYSALIGNHAQSVTNLGFGAAMTYTGSTLFGPMDVAKVYDSGARALACVANRGATLRTTVLRNQARVAFDDGQRLPGKLVDACNPDAKDMAEALAAQDKAKRLLAYAIGGDASEAHRIREAAEGVISAVNSDLIKRSNNPETVFAAAKTLAPRVGGTVIEQKDVQVTSGRGGPRCAADVDQQIRQFTQDYLEIERSIIAALNSMAALDKSCVLEQMVTEALALSQEEVNVPKDSSFNVVISGGRPPYVITPIGAVSKDINVQLVAPRTIVITGLSTLKAGTTSTFQVKDNSVITSPKTLKVTTK